MTVIYFVIMSFSSDLIHWNCYYSTILIKQLSKLTTLVQKCHEIPWDVKHLIPIYSHQNLIESLAGSYNQWSIKATNQEWAYLCYKLWLPKWSKDPMQMRIGSPKSTLFKTFLGRLSSGFWGNPLGHLFLWKKSRWKKPTTRPLIIRDESFGRYFPCKFALTSGGYDSMGSLSWQSQPSRMHTLKNKDLILVWRISKPKHMIFPVASTISQGTLKHLTVDGFDGRLNAM